MKTSPPTHLTPKAFKAWRERLGLTQQQLAAAFGYSSPRQVGNYERGVAAIPPIVALAMVGLDKAPVPKAAAAANDGTSASDALAQLAGLLDDSALVKDGDLSPLAAYLAKIDGWGLFWEDEEQQGRLEIQRDDSRAVFVDDEAAIAHVRQRAAAGSKLHRLALAIHQNGTVEIRG